jgi:glutathione S-transferase
MKLYYAPSACSLAPHIVAREAGIPIDLERVDIAKAPHITETGADFTRVSPNGYVPTLLLDDASVLTEGAAIVQYLADLNPEAGLAPPSGTLARTRLQSWLNFVGTELHKTYSPWLFHPEVGADAQAFARHKIVERLGFVESHLAAHGPYLMGEAFTVADAYLFTIVSWSSFTHVDLAPFPSLRTFIDRVAARPKVREAIQAETRKLAA